MIWLLASMWALTLVALLFACWRLEHAQAETRAEQAKHISCHKAVRAAVAHVAQRKDSAALLAAADAWDSIEEQGRLRELAREQYVAGGPSMPVIWLRDRAKVEA